jgi:hypothetical protein
MRTSKRRDLEKLLEDPGFREQAARGQERFSGLDVWQGAFLNYLSESNDRLGSSAKAGKSWKEVEESLSDDQSFLDAYEEVCREAVVKLEDRQFQEALEGKNAAHARMALEARSGMYRKKKGSAGSASVRPSSIRKSPNFNAETEWQKMFSIVNVTGESHGPQPDADSGVALCDPESVDELAATGLS